MGQISACALFGSRGREGRGLVCVLVDVGVEEDWGGGGGGGSSGQLRAVWGGNGLQRCSQTLLCVRVQYIEYIFFTFNLSLTSP